MEEKTKFRDQIKEFVRKNLDVEIGNLPPIRQSKAMTRFYVEQIRKTFSPGLIPSDPDDLETCVIDGSDDCGIDFLARADGTVLIIQSKFRGSGVHESLDEFASFSEVLRRIHPDVGRKFKKNQKLEAVTSDIDWDNDFFELVYITLGRCGPNLRAKEKEGPSLGNGLDFLEDRSQLTLSDESDLNVELREALSAGETISGQIPITFVPGDDDSPWLKIEGDHKRSVYLGFVRGSEIAQIYKPHNHRFRLFALNIRDWIGETGTNKGILSTAENRPGDFLFFNNGISAVATSIEEDLEHSILRCKNFSIINGSQTVRSLFKAQTRKPEAVKNVTVMVRISTFSLGKEPEFLEETTRYNNTQNKVSVSDFRSNDPVQRDLAARFGEMMRGGLRFWYKNKRSRELRNRIPIEMEEFAKTIHAFKFGPHDAWGGTAQLFDSGKEGRYPYVFGDGEGVWTKVPNDEFYLSSGIWFLCEEIRRIWKQEKAKKAKDEIAGLALERRYMIYFAVGELLRMIYVEKDRSLDEDIRKLGRPRWTEKDGPEKKSVGEITKLGFSGLTKAYETASRQKDFRHRNWFRSKDYLEGIRSELRFIIEIRGTDNIGLRSLDSSHQEEGR